jgi:EipB-like
VTIAYYATGNAQAQGTPQQEMNLQMYENGVVRDLRIDYGNLAVKGSLSEITFYPPASCPN